LPAIKDGTPVTARYILIINVLQVGDKVPKEQKLPFIFVVTLNYYSETRVTINRENNSLPKPRGFSGRY
jgi:hypothetical protein